MCWETGAISRQPGRSPARKSAGEGKRGFESGMRLVCAFSGV